MTAPYLKKQVLHTDAELGGVNLVLGVLKWLWGLRLLVFIWLWSKCCKDTNHINRDTDNERKTPVHSYLYHHHTNIHNVNRGW